MKLVLTFLFIALFSPITVAQGDKDRCEREVRPALDAIRRIALNQDREWRFLYRGCGDMWGPPEVEDIWFRGDDRVVVWVKVFPSVEDAAASFATYSQPMELCDWTYQQLSNLGDEAIAREECGRAWLRVRRGRLVIRMNASTELGPSQELPRAGALAQATRPCADCTWGSDSESRRLLEFVRSLAQDYLESQRATELPVAAERAQRVRSVHLHAVARAR